MTDKELLELAAKAAGNTGYVYEWIDGTSFIIPGDRPVTWRPLTNDGDAFRLAVTLGLIVDVRYAEPIMSRYNCVTYWTTKGTGSTGLRIEFGDYESDIYAATRRAIVRAAAEIGRAK